MIPEPSRTEQRKRDHVEMILKENVSAEYNFWNDVQLIHNALPEIDFDEIDTTAYLFEKKLAAPLVISSMTGGFGGGKEINAALASGAAEVGIAMGVGSQRAALEKPELAETYRVVADYDIPLRFANLGAPQLVAQGAKRAYGGDDARKAIDMVKANALIVHLNFLQEVVQPEGDKNARGCLAAIETLAREFPLMAKETGAGISRDAALRLKAAGVRAIDVGGLGGTTFSAVEYYRAKREENPSKARLGTTFWNWGIPTPVSLVLANVGLPLVATGGVRTGLDVARAVVLGASSAGMAKPLLEAAKDGPKAVAEELRRVIGELKAAMFLVGAKDLVELGRREALVTRPTSEWMEYARLHVVR